MKCTVLVGIACLALGVALSAMQRPYIVYGHGTASCGDWTSKRQLAASGGQIVTATANAAWVVGFVSGAGYKASTALRKTDSASIDAWMDKYCAEHPLDLMSDAAAKLVDELSAKR